MRLERIGERHRRMDCRVKPGNDHKEGFYD